MKRIIGFFGTVMLVMALMVSTALAEPSHSTLFGKTKVVQPGSNSFRGVELTSDDNPGYGGIDFDTPDDLTFGNLSTLSLDYNVTYGACGGGSPRFEVNIIDPNDPTQTEYTIFVYIGQGPGYTCTPTIWQESGNLLQIGRFVDATQAGGTFYEPYETTLAHFGNSKVTGIQLVTDAGWMFEGNQTVRVDTITIHTEPFTFEPGFNQAL